MPLIVQKFGGTSVADSQKILAAARKAIRTSQQGNQVVMVVSAMGHNTDELIDLAQQITDDPPAREMDMLLSTGEQVSVALMAMAIESLGHKAISFTGAQIGIKTDSTHGKARIQSITTDRMKLALAEGRIVIAAGFQGIDENYNITTLGRGGSDTTAVALAAVLAADTCEIYTDVDGVYTTDPRILPEARKVERISYDEMLELASLGAGVMHNRSIEFAKKFGVPIHVRSSFSDVLGTMIVAEPESPELPVCGAALVKNEARVTLLGVPDRPGTSLAIFSKIAEQHISVDMIVQNVAADGKADISFTVLKDDLKKTLAAANQVVESLKADGIDSDDEVSKVSVVGLGMAKQTGVAEKMFRALADAGVNILMITTSEIKISVLVARSQANDALRAVHQVFALEKGPSTKPAPLAPRKNGSQTDAVAVVSRLAGMEDLTVSNIGLDDSQSRVTVTGVPDTPGLAAQLFEGVAASGIFVDMIVQDAGAKGHANLTFTVPRAKLDDAVRVARELASKLGCGPVTSSPTIAKLSVSGIGMRSHTEVATRMFRALRSAEINLLLINTSEMQVNVIVDGSQGGGALLCLQREFSDTRK